MIPLELDDNLKAYIEQQIKCQKNLETLYELVGIPERYFDK